VNWSQYRLLARMDDRAKREYYELDAVRNGWTGMELAVPAHPLLPPICTIARPCARLCRLVLWLVRWSGVSGKWC